MGEHEGIDLQRQPLFAVELNKILTPEQFSHYLDLREQRREQLRTWEAPKLID